MKQKYERRKGVTGVKFDKDFKRLCELAEDNLNQDNSINLKGFAEGLRTENWSNKYIETKLATAEETTLLAVAKKMLNSIGKDGHKAFAWQSGLNKYYTFETVYTSPEAYNIERFLVNLKSAINQAPTTEDKEALTSIYNKYSDVGETPT